MNESADSSSLPSLSGETVAADAISRVVHLEEIPAERLRMDSGGGRDAVSLTT
jgi:hypothetical protein